MEKGVKLVTIRDCFGYINSYSINNTNLQIAMNFILIVFILSKLLKAIFQFIVHPV
jgi:hypothetical protein